MSSVARFLHRSHEDGSRYLKKRSENSNNTTTTTITTTTHNNLGQPANAQPIRPTSQQGTEPKRPWSRNSHSHNHNQPASSPSLGARPGTSTEKGEKDLGTASKRLSIRSLPASIGTPNATPGYIIDQENDSTTGNNNSNNEQRSRSCFPPWANEGQRGGDGGGGGAEIPDIPFRKPGRRPSTAKKYFSQINWADGEAGSGAAPAVAAAAAAAAAVKETRFADHVDLVCIEDPNQNESQNQNLNRQRYQGIANSDMLRRLPGEMGGVEMEIGTGRIVGSYSRREPPEPIRRSDSRAGPQPSAWPYGPEVHTPRPEGQQQQHMDEGIHYQDFHEMSASPSTTGGGRSSESRGDDVETSSAVTAASYYKPHTGGAPQHHQTEANKPPFSHLPALQSRNVLNNQDHDALAPLDEEDLSPESFDLMVPAHASGRQYSLETRSELLFSTKHLAVIFENPILLQRFTNFLHHARPKSMPLLEYYLRALKALRAIEYANSVSSALGAFPSGHGQLGDAEFAKASGCEDDEGGFRTKTKNAALQSTADRAFEELANHDLPAFITHTYVQTVGVTIRRRIADTLAPHLREMSEGLAEVFCLTDPSRPDNPIVFASEQFHRTTEYGMDYVLGRNCRFLQGPKTNPYSVRRLREAVAAGQEHCETFLNYRRDGSPFMNLLMVAPLYDSRGVVRYHIGAQVDVSGLVKECAGLESLAKLDEKERLGSRIYQEVSNVGPVPTYDGKQGKEEEFHQLAEMFDLQELRTVREHGGTLHRIEQTKSTNKSESVTVTNWNKPRLVISDDASVFRSESDPILQTAAGYIDPPPPSVPSSAPPSASPLSHGGRLIGPYEHYLLVRPYPSLRVLFASPSLRMPGMLQSPLMSRIGGSAKVRDTITQALADGHSLTARVRWIATSRRGDPNGTDTTGRPRWIHCTPLLGSNGAVGVWMVVLVDDEPSDSNAPYHHHHHHHQHHQSEQKSPPSGRRRSEAPPIASHVPRMNVEIAQNSGREDAASVMSFVAANQLTDELGGFRELRGEPQRPMREMSRESVRRGDIPAARGYGGRHEFGDLGPVSPFSVKLASM